jgi:transposase InsO family protein
MSRDIADTWMVWPRWWVMARDGVAVDSKLAAAVAAKAHGGRVDVAGVCRELGVARQTFYKYLARFSTEGVEGFFPRSRRPLTSPSMTPAQVADKIVRARKELAEEGADVGAISIGWRLEDEGMLGVPSRATIHRVLVRRGQVVAQPRKRPRSACRRFEAPRPNAMWQLDGFDVVLADGANGVVLQLMDDHSRLDLASRAAPSENGEDAWAVFQTAAARYGLPRVLLTDNGSAFNGDRRGFTADLQTRVRALGVKPVSSSVAHPQTCGKNERVHATAERWLAKQPPAADLQQLQTQLNTYRDWYNRKRRHQALGGLTPQQRWDMADKVCSDGTPIPAPPELTVRTVSPRGSVGVDGHEVGLGRRHRGAQATVFRTADHVTVFIGTQNIRTLVIDRSRRYQPTGAPPGKHA